jgi:large subunit ribosomal protein L22
MAIRIHNLKPEITAQATAKAIKGSVQKLGLVSNLVKGMNVADALMQLKFSRRRAANDLYVLLKSAVNNAENNQGLDVDNLYVSQIILGKAFTLKRFHARGRGRSAGIQKPYSRVTIFVSVKE